MTHSSQTFIIALDQGTSSSRAVLVDNSGRIVAVEQQEFTQHYPKSGWVEHDPMEILESQLTVFKLLIANQNVSLDSIQAIGITNQRETTVVWDKHTGKPVYNAIVWQDKRTTPICETLKKEGLEPYVKERTGLVIDAYFSATKIQWILENIQGAEEKAAAGDLLFGTVDTWLLWNMTGGKVHATDYTNASRTMIYDIVKLKWNKTILDRLGIYTSMLPEVKPSSHHFGDFEFEGIRIPITGIAGDQQAALFGQTCFKPGMAKNTYGTGCFMLMNTGQHLQYSKNGLLTTIAWGLDGEVHYALEGSVFIAGAAVQWLRDALKIIKTASDTQSIAESLTGDNPVYFVPAFSGLGAPYWDMNARGSIFGLTRDTGAEHLIRATLEAIAYQTVDVLQAMQKDSGIELQALKVDGGACANDYLMQFQADILGVPVEKPECIESTAMGAAYLAGLGIGLWTKEQIMQTKEIDKTFTPTFNNQKRERLYKGWQKALKKSMNWHEED
ncbi:MAG: glycerol kinase GlpK [Flavobacteriaceae bacterium]|nr:glycerol kinase GlpK [Flavobacteriaceae bacterium]MDZ4149172.1 glycerol kinase GlpK [Flavobacteriaceae bacterium]